MNRTASQTIRHFVAYITVGVVTGLILVYCAADIAHSGTVAHRGLRVHAHQGQWAYTQPIPRNPRHIIAPRRTAAAHKILAARPGDIYRLSGVVHGRFKVIAIIDITAAPTANRFWDRRLHVHNTSRFVYMKRVRS